MKSFTLEQLQRLLEILWFQFDHEVEVRSSAEVAVENHGHSANNKVANPRLTQSA